MLLFRYALLLFFTMLLLRHAFDAAGALYGYARRYFDDGRYLMLLILRHRCHASPPQPLMVAADVSLIFTLDVSLIAMLLIFSSLCLL